MERVVFQEMEYGDEVFSLPRFDPSSMNWTPTTPMLSEALAETVIVPETVAPDEGAVRETVGRVVSGADARVVADADVDWAEVFPAASYADTV